MVVGLKDRSARRLGCERPHYRHGGASEPLRRGDVFHGQAGHQGLFDRVLGKKRKVELARQGCCESGLAAPRRAGDDDEQLSRLCHRAIVACPT